MISEFDQEETPSDPNAATRAAALEFAQQYAAVFVHNPVGAALLRHWDETLLRKRVPMNAPHTEYAAVEAQRAFVAGIYDQIRIAKTGAMR